MSLYKKRSIEVDEAITRDAHKLQPFKALLPLPLLAICSVFIITTAYTLYLEQSLIFDYIDVTSIDFENGTINQMILGLVTLSITIILLAISILKSLKSTIITLIIIQAVSLITFLDNCIWARIGSGKSTDYFKYDQLYHGFAAIKLIPFEFINWLSKDHSNIWNEAANVFLYHGLQIAIPMFAMIYVLYSLNKSSKQSE